MDKAGWRIAQAREESAGVSDLVEIRHRETGKILFSTSAAAATPHAALGQALAAAVAAGVDLAGAELRDADARGAMLSGAKLAGACLTGAILDGCDLSGAILTDARMLRVSAIDARFDRADLESAHGWAAVLNGASFNGARAVGANFDHAMLRRADLQGCDLSDASLLRADLSGADFSRSALDGADLRGAIIDTALPEGGGADPLPGESAMDETPGSAAATPDEAGTASVFHWKRRWLVRAGPGAALGAALAGLMSWQIAAGWLGQGSSTFGRITLAAMFAVFALSLGGAAITYILALIRPGPVVTIDGRGIRDTRLSDSPIPWGEIAGWLAVLHGGQLMLMLNVAAPDRFGLSRNPLWAINRLCSRWLGRPELSIRMTGLDGELEGLVKAIQDAAVPHLVPVTSSE